jgi:uncharacterized delta-60 repeat protein
MKVPIVPIDKNVSDAYRRGTTMRPKDRSLFFGWSTGVRTWVLSLILVLGSLYVLPVSPSFGNPGDRDPTFGSSGTSRGSVGTEGRDTAHGILVAPGTDLQNRGFMLIGEVEGDFGLQSYAFAGSGDVFSDDDLAITDFSGREDRAYSATRLPDGSIVAAGSAGSDVALARYLMPAGQLDKHFGNQGRVITDLGGTESAYAAITRPNGLPLIAGESGGRFLLAAYLADGRPDSSFGGDGVAEGEALGVARSIVILSNGSVVAAGDNGADFVMAKYSPSGQLDTSFGDGGVKVIDLGGDEVLGGLVAFDSKLVLAGTTDDNVAIVRLTESGMPDLTFGLGGTVITDFGRVEKAKSVLVQPSGRILVGGEQSGSVMFARYEPTGILDPSFGNSGLIVGGYTKLESAHAIVDRGEENWIATGPGKGHFEVTQFAPDGSVVQSYGRGDLTTRFNRQIRQIKVLGDQSFVALGDSGGNQVVSKYSSIGAPDRTFGINGAAITDQVTRIEWYSNAFHGPQKALAVQDSSKIVVGGELAGDFALARFNPDGTVDATFGEAGSTRTPITVKKGRGASILDLSSQSNGKLVAAGIAGEEIALARFSRDGAADPTFGIGGNVVVPVNGRVKALVIQPDDKVLITATTSNGDVLMRFTEDGASDLSFGINGAVPGASDGLALALQADGKILAGGQFDAGYRFLVKRYLPNGQLDAAFGVGGSAISSQDHFKASRFTRAVVVEPTGVITAAGGDAVARFKPNGEPDSSFASNGMAVFSEFGPNGGIQTAALQGTGRLLIAGIDTNALVPVVTRLEVAPPPVRRIFGWGYNGQGELGDGSTMDRPVPLRLSGLNGLHSASAGLLHSLAVKPDGSVWGWGWNGFGQLGDGSTIDRYSPVRVGGLTGVSQVAAGGVHSLALRKDGTVVAWGWNGVGQLGDGTTIDRYAPVRVAGLTDVIQIAAGGFHSLALKKDGTVWAWGYNQMGQLGDGSTANRSQPVKVSSLTGVTKISAGYMHNIVIGEQRHPWSWGWNALGQLGNYPATNTDSHVPRRTSLNDVIDVSAGFLHGLAVLPDGTVMGWGWNGYGQLGDEDAPTETWPRRILGIDHVIGVSAGGIHSMGIKDDGTAWSWGGNAYGEIGDGTTTDRHKPVQAKGIGALNEVKAGLLHSLAY